MKRRTKVKPVAAIPDAVANGATWSQWCAALRARMTARSAAQHALAHAECDRIRGFYASNGIDPEGVWGVGRWVLDGDDVKPRAVYEREMRKVDDEWRRNDGR